MNTENSSSPGCFAKTIAVFFAILFTLSTCAFLLAWTLDHLAFDPHTYQNALVKADFYNRFPALIAEQMVYSLNQNPCLANPSSPDCQGTSGQASEAPQFLKNLNQQDWQDLLGPLLPTDWLKAQADSAIEQVLTYLGNQSSQLSITISMKDFKTRLAGPEGTAAVQTLLAKQPDCTIEQAAQIALLIASNNLKDFPLCHPPKQVMDIALPYLTKGIAQAAGQIPDQLNLASSAQTSNAVSPAGQTRDPRRTLHLIRQIVQVGFLVPLFCFIIMSIAGIRSLPGWLAWWGLPLLAAGVILSFTALVGFLGTAWLANSLLQPGTVTASGVSPDLIKVVVSAVQNVIRTYLTWTIVEGVALVLIGLFLAAAAGVLAMILHRGIIQTQ